MAWYSDEAWEHISDSNDKKVTARSARNKRGHTGKGGSVRMPSDSLTAKQLRSLHGEYKTYRLGSPMSWSEFSEMPNDLKKMYIKKLRTNYGVPDEELAVSMDIDYPTFANCIRHIGLSSKNIGKNREWYDTDEFGRFQTWWIVKEA
jgi:hypothetical protein